VRLEGYSLLSVDMRGAGLGHVVAELAVDGEAHRSEFRLLHVDSSGAVVHEDDEQGAWLSVGNDPNGIIRRAW
jgi:hypothetical protein